MSKELEALDFIKRGIVMKSILISIKPKWVAMILNGIKTKEIRKLFPKDYHGWVFIYCTKDNHQLVKPKGYDKYLLFTKGAINNSHEQTLNGKVVARFYCDNVTEYINGGQWHDDDTCGSYDDYIKDNILEQSCLTEEELFAYCEDLAFSSVNITQLVIFDKPKELSEFYSYCKDEKCEYRNNHCSICYRTPLTKAPQSYMFIELGE